MRFYENPFKTSENRVKPRAYYIPTGVSAYVSLNGEWKFAYFENSDLITSMPTRWDRISVPSCWQLKGYESPNYSNTAQKEQAIIRIPKKTTALRFSVGIMSSIIMASSHGINRSITVPIDFIVSTPAIRSLYGLKYFSRFFI